MAGPMSDRDARGSMDVLDAVKLLRRAKRSRMADGLAGDFEQIICELEELRRQMEATRTECCHIWSPCVDGRPQLCHLCKIVRESTPGRARVMVSG